MKHYYLLSLFCDTYYCNYNFSVRYIKKGFFNIKSKKLYILASLKKLWKKRFYLERYHNKKYYQ